MKRRAFLQASAMMLAAVVAFIMVCVAAPAEMRAQCNSIQVINNTVCPLTICAGQPSNPNCRFIPADSTVYVSFPLNLPPSGVYNSCGTFVTFPGNGCIEQVPIGPGCCVRVCFDPVTCTVTINKVANQCDC